MSFGNRQVPPARDQRTENAVLIAEARDVLAKEQGRDNLVAANYLVLVTCELTKRCPVGRRDQASLPAKANWVLADALDRGSKVAPGHGGQSLMGRPEEKPGTQSQQRGNECKNLRFVVLWFSFKFKGRFLKSTRLDHHLFYVGSMSSGNQTAAPTGDDRTEKAVLVAEMRDVARGQHEAGNLIAANYLDLVTDELARAVVELARIVGRPG